MSFVALPSMALTEASVRLPEVARRAESAKRRTVLIEDGRPVAVVVPVEDVELLEDLEDVEDLAALRGTLRP